MSNENLERLRCNVEPIFNIGDKVVSKITGLPGVGQVAGYINGQAFNDNTYKGHSNLYWDTLFPNWYEKLIYYVYFVEPRKFIRFDEIAMGQTKENYNLYTEEEWQKYYQKLPEVNLIAYTSDDLELFEQVPLMTDKESQKFVDDFNKE